MEIDRRTLLKLVGAELVVSGIAFVKIGQAVNSAQLRRLLMLNEIPDKRREEFAFLNATLHDYLKDEDNYDFWDLVDDLSKFDDQKYPHRLDVTPKNPMVTSSRALVDQVLIYDFNLNDAEGSGPDIKITRSLINSKPSNTMMEIYYSKEGSVARAPEADLKKDYSAAEFNKMLANCRRDLYGIFSNLLNRTPRHWTYNAAPLTGSITNDTWLASSTIYINNLERIHLVYPNNRLSIVTYYQAGPNLVSSP